MATYRLFVCTITLPLERVFWIFLGSQFIVFAKDWPIQAILVIPDDHECYGVRASIFSFVIFSLGKGEKGEEKICFC